MCLRTHPVYTLSAIELLGPQLPGQNASTLSRMFHNIPLKGKSSLIFFLIGKYSPDHIKESEPNPVFSITASLEQNPGPPKSSEWMILLFLRIQLKYRVHLISQNFPFSFFPFRKLLSKHLHLQKLSSVARVEKVLIKVSIILWPVFFMVMLSPVDMHVYFSFVGLLNATLFTKLFI